MLFHESPEALLVPPVQAGEEITMLPQIT